MTEYPETTKIKELIEAASAIVVVQADNPDGDSLASSLALEQILGDMDKEVTLYCGIDMPGYLHYLPGWDRVQKDLPKQFDLSIIVDTSSNDMFTSLDKNGQRGWLTSKPCIVLDHHATEANIQFATVVCNQKAVSTGEVIYEIAQQLDWKLSLEAMEMLGVSIMSDSLGLVSEGTSPRSIHIIAELVEKGVSLAKLDNERRELMRKAPELLAYKGKLLQRVEFHADQRVATVDIPWEEIETYSPLYNPSMLVIDDMRMTEKTELAVAFKIYKDGKITAKIRCNYGHAIGDKLAEAFGGGGHPYASGFKITDGRSLEEVKNATVQKAVELLG